MNLEEIEEKQKGLLEEDGSCIGKGNILGYARLEDEKEKLSNPSVSNQSEMECIKCGEYKHKNRLRRGMCISCYRKETGLSSGKYSSGKYTSEKDPLEDDALSIVNIRQKIKLIEKESKKLPELKEELKQKMIEFGKKLELELK